MTKKLELYKCEICGNIVEIMHCGEGELVCCGQPMQLLTPNTTEQVKGEYHLPVKIDETNEGDVIRVGAEIHPMTNEHHIEFLQIITADKKCVNTKFFTTEDLPRMQTFDKWENYTARELCNLHGLWENNIK